MTSPKIIQFCTPTPGTIVVLTDTGELWERGLDHRQVAGPVPTILYKWTRIDGPFTKSLAEAKAAELALIEAKRLIALAESRS